MININNKPIIFISHITEEKLIASKLKELIDDAFLESFDIFVSSDENILQSGRRWIDEITENLAKADLVIIIASPISITRPWINFEAGAAWIRDIPAIPACHAGMTISKLPAPINLLQAVDLTEEESVRKILPTIANVLQGRQPSVDFREFVSFVREFGQNYTVNTNLKIFLTEIKEIHSSFPELLRKQHTKTYLTPIDADKIKTAISKLTEPSKNKVKLESLGRTSYMNGYSGYEFYGEYKVSINPKLIRLIETLD